MFRRKFEEKLRNWQENNINTPLLVIGARQVGKTFIINQFLKEKYNAYIYINFDEDKNYVSFFEKDYNPERIIKDIEAYRNEKIDIENTVFFFDEVQKSEKFIASLKYFAESEKAYKIICAGSLLGVKINRFSESFPVGKVYFEYLYPMDFEEFLWAIDENELNEKITSSFEKNSALIEPLHKKALELYYHYLCVGGMPQAILEYNNKNRDLLLFDRAVHRNIISAYLADMGKYAETNQVVKTMEIYNSIPRQLAKENKKFIYKNVSDRAKSQNYSSSIAWLLDAGLLLKCVKVNKVAKPLKFYEEESYFKLYLSDVGLLCNLSEFSFRDILSKSGTEFRGILAENYVAQTLHSQNQKLFYLTETRYFEIDFLIMLDDEIIPIEVKADDNIRSRSLNTYIEKYKPNYAIRLSTKNFGRKKIRSIPLYAVHLLK